MRLLERIGLMGVFLLVTNVVGISDDKIVAVVDQRPEPGAALPTPIVYWTETRTAPRPLRIHALRVDLRSTQCEPVAIIADDPDGDGPAESRLEKPIPLAIRHGVMAAVNANAFDLIPPPPKGTRRVWAENAPVDIIGWALHGDRQASPPQRYVNSFWIDKRNRGHVGMIDTPVDARVAIAGFGSLIRDGLITDTEIKPLHPRSAVGVDRNGIMMWMVIVDGRQTGYSEGMATGELSVLMKELGCWDAINLDGGGSSILLLAKDGKELSIMNRPSDYGTRPVPVMLGVRIRK